MYQLLKSISKDEWRFFAAISFVVMIFAAGPVIFGYLNKAPDQIYFGLQSQGSTDTIVYFSYIKQITDGQILIKDNFTSELQNLGTLNIVWLGVGLLARLFHLSPDAAYHLSRIISTPVLLAAAYVFLAYIFVEKKKRKIAFVFCAFASGLGFYLAPLFLPGFYREANFLGVCWWPLDLWISDTNIFDTIYRSPHFILSWTCLILVFLFSMMAFEKRKLGYALAAGLTAMAFFNFHPYYVPLVFSVVGIYGLYIFVKNKNFDWRLVGYFTLAGLIAAVSITYHFYLLKNSYVIGTRAGQNVTRLYYLLPALAGFGLLSPLALAGIYCLSARRALSDKYVFLIIWLFTSFLLLFAPIQFQSKYFMGMQLPLIIFLVVALYYFYDLAKAKLKNQYLRAAVLNPYIWGILFIGFFCLSNIFNIFRDVYYYQTHLSTFYISRDMSRALAWLDQVPPKGKVVLAADFDAHLVAGLSGQKVYFGHGHETLFYDSKKIMTYWVYASNENDANKKAWLKSQGIDYILYSAEEKILGNFQPRQKDYLKLAFDSPQVLIFEVIKD